jgi:hypothetical protein
VVVETEDEQVRLRVGTTVRVAERPDVVALGVARVERLLSLGIAELAGAVVEDLEVGDERRVTDDLVDDTPCPLRLNRLRFPTQIRLINPSSAYSPS